MKTCNYSLGLVREWARRTDGVSAIFGALMIPVLIGFIGLSVDTAQAYLVRERLARALDAAALAVAGSGFESQQDMQARVNEFINANYPPEKIGVILDVRVSVKGDDVTVSADASYNTAFMWVVGIREVDVSKSTTVRKQVKGVEAVLVLDNTGSMSTNNNIATLRTASANFVNTMFAKARNNDIKIGIVPYANTVRVGLYGRGQVPDPLTGQARPNQEYNDGDHFVTLPAGVTYGGATGTTYNTNTKKYSFSNSTSNHDSSRWYGCVIEHNESGWSGTTNNNDPYPTDVRDEYEGPWETYRYSTLKTQRTCDSNGRNCFNVNVYPYEPIVSSDPNEGCPYANMIPLTSNKQDLLDTIGSMQPHGNTLGNVGMIWGYRMISPEQPFTEGASWDSQYWRKAVIMMTDGDNTKDTSYSYFWLNQINKIGVNDTVTNPKVKGYNTRFEEVCNELRDRDVLVYTVVFTSGVNNTTKNFYKRCATNESMYFYAPSQAELLDVFNQIARELSNLYITE